MPTEEILAEKFNVSRETIREALLPLAEDGTLGRRPRIGTWLVKHPAEAFDQRLTGPFENFATLSGVKIELSSETRGEIGAKPEIAMVFMLRNGERVYRFHRVRTYEGQPIVVVEALFPLRIGRKVATRNLSGVYILPTLRAAVDPNIYEQYQQIEAVSPSADIVRLLKVSRDAPVLLVKRIFVDSKGRAAGVFRSHFRSDLYYYTVNLPKMRDNSNGQPPKSAK